MAIQDVTKPMALDETLQGTNGKLDTHNGKMDTLATKLQAIADALSIDASVYKAAGNKACAELLPALLIEDNLGNVYNMTDAGTTTSDFVEGAGKTIDEGSNVAVVDIGTGGSHVYKFDILSGFVDLSNYVQKEVGKGLSSNDYTTAEKTKLSGISTGATKTESSQTNGNIEIDGTETQVYDDSDVRSKLPWKNDTVKATNKAPYLRRQALSVSGASVYTRLKLVGATFGVNQLCQNGDFSDGTTGWTASNGNISVTSGICSFTASAQNGYINSASFARKTGHRYLIGATIKLSTTTDKVRLYSWGSENSKYFSNTTEWQTLSYIITSIRNIAGFAIEIIDDRTSDFDVIQIRSTFCIDLTQWFNPDIADYAYTLEQSSAGSGISWLASYDFDFSKYIDYNTGSLQSVKTSAKKLYDSNNTLIGEISLGNDELRGVPKLVDGEIQYDGDTKSADGVIDSPWSEELDLGDLNWTVAGTNKFTCEVPNKANGLYNMKSSKYITSKAISANFMGDYEIIGHATGRYIYILDPNYTDATAFTTAVTGQKLIFEKVTPTTSQSTPFDDPISMDGVTVEEFIDNRTIPIPVGHETQYMGASDEIYEVPSKPTSDGVWLQKMTIVNGKEQFSWVRMSDIVADIVAQIGNTDISAIGDGTITGAISSLAE